MHTSKTNEYRTLHLQKQTQIPNVRKKKNRLLDDERQLQPKEIVSHNHRKSKEDGRV
jgi:hypothetical protein